MDVSRSRKYRMVTSDIPAMGCVEFALSNKSTTFAEMEDILVSVYKMPVKRDDGFVSDIFLNDWSNVLLWIAATPEMADVFHDVIGDDRVEMKPTVPLLYMMDGKVLTIPLAKRVPKLGYKNPRWLPVVIVGRES